MTNERHEKILNIAMSNCTDDQANRIERMIANINNTGVFKSNNRIISPDELTAFANEYDVAILGVKNNDNVDFGNNYWCRFNIEDRSEYKIDIDKYISRGGEK